jgi:hypothetical protein
VSDLINEAIEHFGGVWPGDGSIYFVSRKSAEDNWELYTFHSTPKHMNYVTRDCFYKRLSENNLTTIITNTEALRVEK